MQYIYYDIKQYASTLSIIIKKIVYDTLLLYSVICPHSTSTIYIYHFTILSLSLSVMLIIYYMINIILSIKLPNWLSSFLFNSLAFFVLCNTT